MDIIATIESVDPGEGHEVANISVGNVTAPFDISSDPSDSRLTEAVLLAIFPRYKNMLVARLTVTIRWNPADPEGNVIRILQEPEAT